HADGDGASRHCHTDLAVRHSRACQSRCVHCRASHRWSAVHLNLSADCVLSHFLSHEKMISLFRIRAPSSDGRWNSHESSILTCVLSRGRKKKHDADIG